MALSSHRQASTAGNQKESREHVSTAPNPHVRLCETVLIGVLPRVSIDDFRTENQTMTNKITMIKVYWQYIFIPLFDK